MKIVNIESFPIRVSNSSDKGRKIDTKNIGRVTWNKYRKRNSIWSLDYQLNIPRST